VVIKISERKIGAILSYLNIILQTTVNFLYIPLLLYYIGQQEYGLYQLIGSLIAYLSIVDFGLSSMVIRFYAKSWVLGDKKGAENILAIARRGYIVICLVVLIAGGIFYQFLPQWFGEAMSEEELHEALIIYLLMLFNFAITMLGMVYQAVINARQKFLFLRGTSCLQCIFQPLLVLVVLQEYPYALGVATATTLLNVVLIIWRWLYARRRLRVRIVYHYWNRELLQGVGYFLLMQFIVSVADLVFFKTNQVILGIISGTAAVAVYAIAANIQQAYMMMSTSISGVFLAYVTELVTQRVESEEISALFIRIGRLQFFALGLAGSGFIIFGQEFIALWAGEGFEDSYWIALLIMLPFTTDLIQNVGFAILQAMNRYGIRAAVQTLVGAINIVLAVPLGMKYGGIGCAAATGFCMFLGNGIGMSYCYAHYLNLQMGKFWRQILWILLRMALLTVVVYGINYSLPKIGGVFFAVKAIVYVVAYGVVAYFCCFNEYERSLCVGWLKKRC